MATGLLHVDSHAATPTAPTHRTLVTLASPASFAAEQYRGLRLKIERLRQTRDLRVVAVTSPGVNDGKSVTSINLAAACAQAAGARVLLIDADLRRPSLGTYLGLGNWEELGLSDALGAGEITLNQVVRKTPHGGLSIIPAGSRSTPVHELFESPKFDALLRDARQQYDLIVLDTPPLLPVNDALVLSRAVDGLLIVVAANETPRKRLEEALDLVDASKVLGIVFNRDNARASGQYNEYYER
jgi:capsular exopolysaccharide synthesis family protein